MSAVCGNETHPPRLLVIACGALATEIIALRDQLGLAGETLTLQCLPAEYHNRPEKIAPAVEAILQARLYDFDRILVGYGECGTGGSLDVILRRYGVERLPFAHCYEFFAGTNLFTKIIEEEIGSFFLTDYLVKNFDRLVIKGLGLDRLPHLRELYFGNYKQVVYLAQTADPDLKQSAITAASKLGLVLDYRLVGYGALGCSIAAAADMNIDWGENP